jgi:hypothetical protein
MVAGSPLLPRNCKSYERRICKPLSELILEFRFWGLVQSKIGNLKSKIAGWEGAVSRKMPKSGNLPSAFITGLSGEERKVSQSFPNLVEADEQR